MKGKLIGALVLLLLIIGTAAAWKYIEPMLAEKTQKKYSDAAKMQGKITIALDNWIGYWPLRSPEMKAQLRAAGWQLEVIDDGADYGERAKNMSEGKYHFAVGTVDSVILNDSKYGFSSVMTNIIDESKGADCILGLADKVKSLDAIKGNSKLRVAFTPDSPSHHLGKATVGHFNVPELLPAKGDNRRIETKGSKEAVDKLLAGTTDIAIAWEPDVSRALAHNGVIKLLGTEDTTKLIVDVLTVNREFARKDPLLVKKFLDTYFKALKYYRDNPDQAKKEIKAETKLTDAAVDSMLKGVHWVTLTENCEKWFGISAPGTRNESWLLDTIESTVRILITAGDFKQNPLPNKDPTRLVYSAFLEELYTSSQTGFTLPAVGATASVNSLEAKFSPLSEDGWKKLREIGTLKMAPIVFQSGVTELDETGKEVIDEAVKSLQHYPHFRILVKGHTAPGDEEQNLILSRERAEAVARYLNVVYSVDPNRMKAQGYGGTQPLKQLPGESKRTYYYRLPRTEMVLVREEL